MINIYGNGILFCSVCTDQPIEETVAAVNELNPTGISSKWEHTGVDFRTGESSPHPCENDAKKNHILLTC